MGTKIGGGDELHRVGGDQRQCQALRQMRSRTDMGFHVGRAGSLNLEVVSTGQHGLPLPREGLGGLQLARGKRHPHITALCAGQYDQAATLGRILHKLAKPLAPHFSMTAWGIFQPCARKQLAQVAVAGPIAHQHQHLKGTITLGIVAEPQAGAQNGLDAPLTGGPIELDPAEDIGCVGNGKRSLPVLRSRRDQIVDPHDRVADGVLGSDSEMDELRRRHRAILQPRVEELIAILRRPNPS